MRVWFGILVLCVACSPEPQAGPIDAAKAERFVAYQQQLLPLLRKWAKPDGRAAMLQEMDAAREANGLSDEDVAALSQIGTLVALRSDSVKSSLQASIEELQHTVGDMPAAARNEGQKSLAALQELRANVLDLKEMRQKYGDPIVDAMLERAAELQRQRLEFASIR